ncbi:amidase family protein [Sinomonas albida]|uniref:amidase family protein n=1 Tax=Sinomonas albida TaxID=369942 RepID=UPI003016B3AC
MAVRAQLRTTLADVLARARVAALVSPTLPAIVPRGALMSHELTGETGGDSLSSALRMLSPANLTGLPGVSVPCGLAEGQPVGLHLMGPAFSDGALLGIAGALRRGLAVAGDGPAAGLAGGRSRAERARAVS